MNHISLTIPADDPRALVAGAVMLLTAAGKLPEIDLDDLSGKTCTGSGSCGGHSHGPEVAEIDPKAWANLPPVPSTAAVDQSPTAPVETQDISTKQIASSAHAPTVALAENAPMAPAAPSTPASGVELDTDALPWDARIHSSSKARNADGRWKKKRNIDETLIAQVEHELHALMALPSPVAAAPVRPPLGGTWPTAPAPLESAARPAPVWPFPNPGETPAPPPPPPAPDATTEPMTFPSFLKSVSGLVQAKRITMPRVNDILTAAAVPNLSALGTRPDLIPAIWAQIDSETAQ
jgi:hypothetical protein